MSEINFPVVGIGASAGGLKALQNFFDHLPPDTGMAFVVIVHLAPEKSSAMDELLASHSQMKVQQIHKDTSIEPNHVYIIPPSKQLRIHGKELVVEAKEKDSQAVIDIFFRSMAEECEKNAIGIVLSGTGSDGTVGLKAVKEYGGIIMAQEPEEADYGGMPLSAINTDLVDFVMPVKGLAMKVMDYKDILGKVEVPIDENNLDKKETEALDEIFKLLISQKSHDFSQYKRASILRRLQRRLYVCSCNNITEYRKYLDENPDEIDHLLKDLLISVTQFFRDPEAYEKLEKEIIPKLFKGKDTNNPVRVWVVGCATGEEVYSLAILLHEYASTLNYMPKIKIFGTDLSDEALRIARKGVYPEPISTDISERRLKRYFHKEDGQYRIRNVIRNLVLISKHNILADPPFVKQDLISCRNLLIYFNKKLQNEALKIIHHSLKDDGYLFLGASDSLNAAADFFNLVDKSNGIYQSRFISASQKEIPLSLFRNMGQMNVGWIGGTSRKEEVNFEQIHQRLLAEEFAPPSVIIDENSQVLHSSKGIERYLQYREGEPSLDLLKMVSAELYRPLKRIIFQYRKMESPKPLNKRIKIKHQNNLLTLNLQIRPIKKQGIPSGYCQIIFEEIEQSRPVTGTSQLDETHNPMESEVVRELEKELEQSRIQLQQIIGEYETSNEELMSSNEELQSMNEELQSATEELQSVNEELKIVNEEREAKIQELQSANDDLKNLMEATEIGIMFLNRNLELKRFTSSIKKLFNLIESDLDRPLSHITNQIQDIDLVEEVNSMLETLNPIKRVIRSTGGRWYKMQIKPYKTTEYKVEGAVVTFMDITDLKKAEKLIRKRGENEEALVKLGIELMDYEDPQKVLDKAAEMLRARMNFSHLALLKYNPKGDELQLVSGYGWDEDEQNALYLSLGINSVFDYALKNDSPVVVNDFNDEDRFERVSLLNDHGITSGITAVISGSKSSFGILGVYAGKQRTFEEHEINFIQNTAYRIGEALERIQTEEELTSINKELQDKIEIQKQLQQDVLRVEKKERWSIGQFLHDEISQNLLAIKTLLDSSPQVKKLNQEIQDEINDIKQLIVESLQNIRELSHFVLPLGEGAGCAADALNLLVKQTENVYEIDCSLITDEFAGGINTNSITTSLYYIAQEAITNAIKHGQADKIEIVLSSDDNYLYMVVEDNGIGYDEDEDENGQGINIMKYRAELLGGTLEINGSSATNSTLVKCILPLKNFEE